MKLFFKPSQFFQFKKKLNPYTSIFNEFLQMIVAIKCSDLITTNQLHKLIIWFVHRKDEIQSIIYILYIYMIYRGNAEHYI